uniref:SCP domain-containing protein n=1 Tax=Mesocestoides corti TaxID=53468 RepID=A0A5K3F1L3_MESCO
MVVRVIVLFTNVTSSKGMKHIACLITLMSYVMAKDQLQLERDGILNFHVRTRATVQPTASNMMLMTYSKKMEDLARRWVERCEFKHPNPATDPQYKGIGQNLALTGGYTPNLTQMAQGWYDEIKNYDYEKNSCNGVCGHYTQMVWATSVSLGCAKKQCDSIKPDWRPPVYLMACQYEPAGNYIGKRPYEQGGICSKCPTGYVCEKNQCAEKTTTTATPLSSTTTSVATLPSACGFLVYAIFLIQISV